MSSKKQKAHKNVECSFREALISEVQKRPCLWNTKSKHYQNNILKAKMWEEIYNCLNDNYPDFATSSAAVKHTWIYLRDYYRRLVNKITSTKSGAAADDAYTTGWIFWEHMSFVQGTITFGSETISSIGSDAPGAPTTTALAASSTAAPTTTNAEAPEANLEEPSQSLLSPRAANVNVAFPSTASAVQCTIPPQQPEAGLPDIPVPRILATFEDPAMDTSTMEAAALTPIIDVTGSYSGELDFGNAANWYDLTTSLDSQTMIFNPTLGGLAVNYQRGNNPTQSLMDESITITPPPTEDGVDNATTRNDVERSSDAADDDPDWHPPLATRGRGSGRRGRPRGSKAGRTHVATGTQRPNDDDNLFGFGSPPLGQATSRAAGFGRGAGRAAGGTAAGRGSGGTAVPNIDAFGGSNQASNYDDENVLASDTQNINERPSARGRSRQTSVAGQVASDDGGVTGFQQRFLDLAAAAFDTSTKTSDTIYGEYVADLMSQIPAGQPKRDLQRQITELIMALIQD